MIIDTLGLARKLRASGASEAEIETAVEIVRRTFLGDAGPKSDRLEASGASEEQIAAAVAILRRTPLGQAAAKMGSAAIRAAQDRAGRAEG